MSIQSDRELGRAKNAILELIQKRLIVPKIYFNATWERHDVDLLAIDRDGIGDVHVVDIKRLEQKLDHLTIMSAVSRLREVRAQFKYLAILNSIPDERSSRLLTLEEEDALFAEDGIGRIGLITLSSEDDKPVARLAIPPERFRAFVSSVADTFVTQHEPDWEIRA